jgi:hypothetical protein
MGGCCTRSSNQGEKLVRDIMNDSNFTLNQLTVQQLTDEFAHCQANGTVSKDQLLSLYHKFFNNKKSENPYFKIYQTILDSMLSKLSLERVDLNEVIFYLYPYLNHHGQKDLSQFYSIINHFHRSNLTPHQFEECLHKYLDLHIMTVTQVIFKDLENGPEREELYTLLQNVVTPENILKELKHYMNQIPKNQTTPITQEEFKTYFKNSEFCTYEDIRDNFFAKYDQR